MRNIIEFKNLGLKLSVNRVAFDIFGFEVYWYGIIIGFGMALAFIYAAREFKRQNLHTDDLLNMFLIALPVAIVSARLYYVIFNFQEYSDDLLKIFDIRSGGIAVYGGLIGAAIVVILYCRTKKIRLGAVLDILAVGFLIGQAVGRWGNFVNGEAYGSTTNLPWAMTVTSGGVTYADSVHPTFFYESLWNMIGIAILMLYKNKKKFDGEVFLLYLLWYGLGRFWIEAMRSDSLYLANIRVSQLVAAISVVISTAGIIIGRHIKKQTQSNQK